MRKYKKKSDKIDKFVNDERIKKELKEKERKKQKQIAEDHLFALQL